MKNKNRKVRCETHRVAGSVSHCWASQQWCSALTPTLSQRERETWNRANNLSARREPRHTFQKVVANSLLIAIVFFVVGFFAVGCGNENGASSNSPLKRTGSDPIRVVCTTGMVADVVRNVGGDQVKVVQLMGEGVDPHLYKASLGDVTEMSDAEIIFYSGLHLEGHLARTFEDMAKSKPTFALGDELVRWQNEKLFKGEKGVIDPHVWFDVSLWSTTVKMVADRLADYDPEHANDYAQRANEYRLRLEELDAWAESQLRSIPEHLRVMVTAHDAFRYFGKRYGIDVRGIQGISTESEASLKDVEELVESLVRKKIKAIFVESSVPEANIQAVIDGCKAKGHTLERGGTLFSDAMGKDGTPEGTYEGMVRHNVTTIVNALK